MNYWFQLSPEALHLFFFAFCLLFSLTSVDYCPWERVGSQHCSPGSVRWRNWEIRRNAQHCQRRSSQYVLTYWSQPDKAFRPPRTPQRLGCWVEVWQEGRRNSWCWVGWSPFWRKKQSYRSWQGKEIDKPSCKFLASAISNVPSTIAWKSNILNWMKRSKLLLYSPRNNKHCLTLISTPLINLRLKTRSWNKLLDVWKHVFNFTELLFSR